MWRRSTRVLSQVIPGGLGNHPWETDTHQPNRLADARGVFYLEWSANPGTPGGTARMEGKLSVEAPMARVFQFDPDTGAQTAITLTMNTAKAPNWSAAKVGIPMLPYLRWASQNTTNSNLRTLRCWIIE